MTPAMYCADDEAWTDCVALRHGAEPSSERRFAATRANATGRQKQSAQARHSRASRSSTIQGGISRRGKRRVQW